LDQSSTLWNKREEKPNIAELDNDMELQCPSGCASQLDSEYQDDDEVAARHVELECMDRWSDDGRPEKADEHLYPAA